MNDRIWTPQDYRPRVDGLVTLLATYSQTTHQCVENYLLWHRSNRRAGAHDPSFDMLSRILGAAGVPLEEIFRHIFANLIHFVPPQNRGTEFTGQESAAGGKQLEAVLRQWQPRWVLCLVGSGKADDGKPYEVTVGETVNVALGIQPVFASHPRYANCVEAQRERLVQSWRSLGL
jgi:hypothetical protein